MNLRSYGASPRGVAMHRADAVRLAAKRSNGTHWSLMGQGISSRQSSPQVGSTDGAAGNASKMAGASNTATRVGGFTLVASGALPCTIEGRHFDAPRMIPIYGPYSPDFRTDPPIYRPGPLFNQCFKRTHGL